MAADREVIQSVHTDSDGEEERQTEILDRIRDDDHFDALLEDEEEFLDDITEMREHSDSIGSVAEGTVTDASYHRDGRTFEATVLAPDGRELDFSIRVGTDELTDKMAAFLDAVGTDRLGDAIGESVPLIYTESGWKLHLPYDSSIKHRAVRWCFRRGLYTYRYREPVSAISKQDCAGITLPGAILLVGMPIVIIIALAAVFSNGFLPSAALFWLFFYPYHRRLQTIAADN